MKKQLAPGVVVIGHYDMHTADPKVIGEELAEMTKDLPKGYSSWHGADWTDESGAEVRTPETSRESGFRLLAKRIENDGWHRDAHDSPLSMIVWSNQEQTEIRTPDGTVIQTEPGDVIIIDNLAVEHRTPPNASLDRWFFRRYVQTPDWLTA